MRTSPRIRLVGPIVVALSCHSVPAEEAVRTEPRPAVRPSAVGILDLEAGAATIHGATARFLVVEGVGNICYWVDPADWVSWDLVVERACAVVVELRYSCQEGSEGSDFEVAVGDERLGGRIAEPTGTWYDHRSVELGRLELRAGPQELALRPKSKPGQAVMNLAWIRLVPVDRWAAYREKAAREEPGLREIVVVPNFHPASCGWLTDFSTERNYCANSYLAHLDRVRDDAAYAFAFSEVNTLMAILAFAPDRVDELKRRIVEGRVELANAFFLEPTINLSGGEALVKQGIEGLRWQEAAMGSRRRSDGLTTSSRAGAAWRSSTAAFPAAS